VGNVDVIKLELRLVQAQPTPETAAIAPFELASAHRTVRRGTIPLLAAISRDLEHQAARSSRTSLLISSFPGVDRWM
jgi:hypothetical protein